MRRHGIRRRWTSAAVLAATVVLTGCSFRGSLTDTSTASAPRTGTHRPASASTTSPAGGATATTAATSGHGTATSGAAATVGQPAAATTGGTVGAPSRCHTGDLGASLVAGSPAAGQRYAVLVLTNTSGRTCTIDGYGGIGLVAPSGAALPTRQVRLSSPAPGPVTLPPRAAARSQLRWSAVAGSGDAQQGPCQPTPAALRVIPPDETTSLGVGWTQGPVCEQGAIDQNAYAAG